MRITKKQLKEIKDNTDNKLKKYVLNYALKWYKADELKGFFEDLLKYGCVSGMINDLIYYYDTAKFYDKYEDEIEDLISENMDSLGIKTRPLFIESLNGSAENLSQEKNLLSWFAFEEIAREIYTQDLMEIMKEYKTDEVKQNETNETK